MRGNKVGAFKSAFSRLHEAHASGIGRLIFPIDGVAG